MKSSKSLKKTLIDLDLNVTSLAKGIGRSRTWTSQIINDNSTAPETRKLILDFIEKRSLQLGVKVAIPWSESRKKAA